MKNRDLKKGKESIIGKIIYGFLLFMPLLAILFTCLYTTFNKNAYVSYDDNYVKSAVNMALPNTTAVGNTYQLTYKENLGTTTAKIGYTDISIDWTQYGASNQYDYKMFYIQQTTTGNTYINLYETDTAPLQSLYNVWGFTLNEFTFTSDRNQPLADASFNCAIITFKNNSLSDSFYHAVDKVEQSNLFNWATNSIIYTGISNTCTQLSITNTFIPLLLAYWLIISVIYILYDIILMLLIILHNKIHQLQDSLS